MAGGFDANFKLKFYGLMGQRWKVNNSNIVVNCLLSNDKWLHKGESSECTSSLSLFCISFDCSFFICVHLSRRGKFGFCRNNLFRHSHMDYLLSYFQCGSNIRSHSSNNLAPLQLSKVHLWKVWSRAYIDTKHKYIRPMFRPMT